MRKDITLLVLAGLAGGVLGHRGSSHIRPRDVITTERAPIEAMKDAKAASEARVAGQIARLKGVPPANSRIVTGSSSAKVDSAVSLAAATSNNTASIQLYVDHVYGFDRGYGAYVDIGTPVQQFLVIMDTGSSDLWLMGPGSSNNHTLFDPSKSSTYQATSYNFQDTYGKGESTGAIGLENVEFGNFTVTGQPIGVASEVDSSFTMIPKISGIFGLAWASIAQIGSGTWLETVAVNGLLAEPYFSMILGRGTGGVDAAEEWQKGGELCLGCTASVMDGQVGSATNLPLLDEAWWEVAMDGVTIGGRNVSGTSEAVIIDSGTSLIQLSTSTCQAIAQAAGGTLTSDGFVAVPTSVSLSSIEFVLGGTSFEVAPADLVLGTSDDGGYYILGIGASDQNDRFNNPLGILGAVFMKSVRSDFWYSYNGGNPAVVLSPITGDSSASSVLSQTAVTSDFNPVTVTDIQTTGRASITGSRATITPLGTGATTTGATATGTSNSGSPGLTTPKWMLSTVALFCSCLGGNLYH